ncbi:transcriptional regulator [Actinoplanes sp. NPDC051494]|uniref:transcriptional regulator n=1 Tax=Actinoplanes sp. NPDC051494 TaxID=3363907 RepID=UPI0037ABCBDA
MTSDELMVLHALRCMGWAGLPRVAGACGLAEGDVESTLLDLAVSGLVTYLPGDFSGWGVTEAGKEVDAARVTEELAAAGAGESVGAAYGEFVVLNAELLDLCTVWQLRTVERSRVLAGFGVFDQRAAGVIADLAAALPRFARYRTRLGAALERARAGAFEHLADSLDSYHAVWFQLHEDLLVTLGIPRSS